MISSIENEIIQLHQFFQDWYNNVLNPIEENFARFTEVLAPDFLIIFPDGKIVNRQTLLDSLRKAHNSRTGMRIWIKNVQIHQEINGLILATYEEWQEINGETTARLSSALFREAESTPNRLQWLHVHETWITIENNGING